LLVTDRGSQCVGPLRRTTTDQEIDLRRRQKGRKQRGRRKALGERKKTHYLLNRRAKGARRVIEGGSLRRGTEKRPLQTSVTGVTSQEKKLEGIHVRPPKEPEIAIGAKQKDKRIGKPGG